MKKTSFAVTAALALILQACASSGPQSGYEGLPSDSRAYRIARAAGIQGIRDVRIPEGTNIPSTGIFDSSIVGGVVGALSPAAGFTSLTSGALGFLAGASGPKAPTWPVLIAWVPPEKATTATDAVEAIVEAIETADITVSVQKFAPDVAVVRAEERIGKNYDGYRIQYNFTSEKCFESKRCGYQLSILPPTEIGPLSPPQSEPVKSGILSTSGFPSYSYVPDSRIDYAKATFPDYDIMTDYTARLPEWMYILFPAMTLAYQNESGHMSFLKYPIILHQGKTFFFVKNH
ncbi:hypothetical protein WI697_18150 [Tistrella mobilis]|uniref:hypothetical protein n=1 Tax=Tistrella mobilis TaxID=171437 RepID=UPI0031F64344